MLHALRWAFMWGGSIIDRFAGTPSAPSQMTNDKSNRTEMINDKSCTKSSIAYWPLLILPRKVELTKASAPLATLVLSLLNIKSMRLQMQSFRLCTCPRHSGH